MQIHKYTNNMKNKDNLSPPKTINPDSGPK